MIRHIFFIRFELFNISTQTNNYKIKNCIKQVPIIVLLIYIYILFRYIYRNKIIDTQVICIQAEQNVTTLMRFTYDYNVFSNIFFTTKNIDYPI